MNRVKLKLPLVLVAMMLGCWVTPSLSVTYELSFSSSWTSSDMDPGIGLPTGAHFTNIIGSTHSSGNGFWNGGEKAIPAVEKVTELGFNGDLRAVLTAMRSAGLVGSVIEGGSLANFPATSKVQFEVTTDRPFVSLMSMITPSPDWFVGVSSFSLLQTNGAWYPNVTRFLNPWDGGTENGVNFVSTGPNNTNPQFDIMRLDHYAGSPFNGNPIVASVNFKLVNITTPTAPAPIEVEFVTITPILQLLLD